MKDKMFKDIRTNAIVRVNKELNATTVMVTRIKDKQKYITDISNLKEIDYNANKD